MNTPENPCPRTSRPAGEAPAARFRSPDRRRTSTASRRGRRDRDGTGSDGGADRFSWLAQGRIRCGDHLDPSSSRRTTTFLSSFNLTNLVLQVKRRRHHLDRHRARAAAGRNRPLRRRGQRLAAAVMAVLNTKHGWAPIPAIGAGLKVGVGIGLSYGFFVNKFCVPSFVVTLAGLLAWQGALLLVLGDTGTINLNDATITGLAARLRRRSRWALVRAVVVGAYAASGLLERTRRSRAGLPPPALAASSSAWCSSRRAPSRRCRAAGRSRHPAGRAFSSACAPSAHSSPRGRSSDAAWAATPRRRGARPVSVRRAVSSCWSCARRSRRSAAWSATSAAGQPIVGQQRLAAARRIASRNRRHRASSAAAARAVAARRAREDALKNSQRRTCSGCASWSSSSMTGGVLLTGMVHRRDDQRTSASGRARERPRHPRPPVRCHRLASPCRAPHKLRLQVAARPPATAHSLPAMSCARRESSSLALTDHDTVDGGSRGR